MTEEFTNPRVGIYDTDDLTADQRDALTRKCNDAFARASLRKLRSLILFAQSEPSTLPVYDEDTGKFGPQPNYDAIHPVRSLIETSMQCPVRSAILRELGWSEDMLYADWETMLSHLPAERFQPLPWLEG